MNDHNLLPLLASPETPRGEVEIKQGDAITVNEALAFAQQEAFPIGKSTLQRWAKIWSELGINAPVKCVLITNRQGSVYKLDRSDFLAWVFDVKENDRSQQAPLDIVRPKEIQEDLAKHDETSQDLTDRTEEVQKLESKLEEIEEEKEKLASKFQDETVLRKVHEYRADRAEEAIENERDRTDRLLKIVGAQEHKLRELGLPEMDVLRLSQPNAISMSSMEYKSTQEPNESSPD